MAIAPGTRLGRYDIRAPLGAGGMGEVYLAEDTSLHRKVAIKFLSSETAHDDHARKRLLREAQSAATLDHPNICAIYEVGEADGHHFIVMQLVEGETLAARLAGRPLDLRESLSLATQIADALSAAHAHGVLHRDIKPQNIMITPRGQAKLMDFGLAIRAPEASPDAGEATTESLLTTPGAILGTVKYMSPEQVQGQPLDARSDIFSFGVVLYEMVSGRHPFAAENHAATIAAILTRPPEPVARFAPQTPAELDRIVMKAIVREKDERYQSIKDLLIDLQSLVKHPEKEALAGRSQPRGGVPLAERRRRWLAGVASAAVVLASVGWWFAGRSSAIGSLAVLPFVNSGGDTDTEYLSDGISESLITSLSRVPNLQVKSRDSVFRYKGKSTEIRTAARELGVRAVLKGRLVRRGESLSVDVELVDGRDNLIWRNQYSRKMDDVLAIEEAITQEVSDTLRPKLTSEERQLVGRPSTRSVEAHELYLRGRYAWQRRTEKTLRTSLEYFTQASDKDPTYAAAWAGQADCYNMLAAWGVMPGADVYPRARDAARRALELDDTLAQPHASLARVKTDYEWDWAGAEQEYKRAIQLDPTYGTAHHWYAVQLAAVGRRAEAIDEALRARDLDPLSPAINFNVAWFRFIAGQYAQASADALKVIELDGNYAWGHNALGSVYLQTQRTPEALSQLQLGLDRSERGVLELTYLAHAYAVSGAHADARKLLEELQHRTYVPPDAVAFVYVGLGDGNNAFKWFEKAFAERAIRAWFLPDPRLDPIRSDARFKDLMSRMGLGP